MCQREWMWPIGPLGHRRGGGILTQEDKASWKRPRGMRNPQTVNAGQLYVDIQPRVEGHPKDVGHIQDPARVCTQIFVLGHRKTLTQLLWEITKSQKVMMKSPLWIWIRENHIIKTTLCRHLFILMNCERPGIGSRTQVHAWLSV
jgi:hypothetical protein